MRIVQGQSARAQRKAFRSVRFGRARVNVARKIFCVGPTLCLAKPASATAESIASSVPPDVANMVNVTPLSSTPERCDRPNICSSHLALVGGLNTPCRNQACRLKPFLLAFQEHTNDRPGFT